MKREGVMASNAVNNANMKSSGQLLIEFISSSAESSAELRAKRQDAYIKRKVQAIVAEKAEKNTELKENKEVQEQEEKDQPKRIDKKV